MPRYKFTCLGCSESTSKPCELVYSVDQSEKAARKTAKHFLCLIGEDISQADWVYMGIDEEVKLESDPVTREAIKVKDAVSFQYLARDYYIPSVSFNNVTLGHVVPGAVSCCHPLYRPVTDDESLCGCNGFHCSDCLLDSNNIKALELYLIEPRRIK